MHRRRFLQSAGWATGTALTSSVAPVLPFSPSSYRDLFPRLQQEIFLNAAGGTPLAAFAESGIQNYLSFWQLGPGEERGAHVSEMLGSVASLFADLVGADTSEIALVHCTKQGEQIVLDSLNPWADGGHVVTNDFHFSGSLHSYLGHTEHGREVRIVRSTSWQLPTERMIAAIDDKTRLVAVTLVSNMNGRLEDAKALADAAHRHGAYIYLDIIQAAGCYPLDLKALDADFAACSGYKWLFGPHGAGFLYVRSALQGRVLQDRLFPGHTRPNYAPWAVKPDPAQPLFSFEAPDTAQRYQPGHISYLGYAALYEALRFIQEVGVSTIHQHAIDLNQHLLRQLDQDRFPAVSEHHAQTPILSLWRGTKNIEPALRSAQVTVALPHGLIRVSPSIYNTLSDMDTLAHVLNTA